MPCKKPETKSANVVVTAVVAVVDVAEDGTETVALTPAPAMAIETEEEDDASGLADDAVGAMAAALPRIHNESFTPLARTKSRHTEGRALMS